MHSQGQHYVDKKILVFSQDQSSICVLNGEEIHDMSLERKQLTNLIFAMTSRKEDENELDQS